MVNIAITGLSRDIFIPEAFFTRLNDAGCRSRGCRLGLGTREFTRSVLWHNGSEVTFRALRHSVEALVLWASKAHEYEDLGCCYYGPVEP